MTIEFASLGSGSNGNATLVRTADATVMVDCGFSLANTRKRAHRLDVCLSTVDAIVVTHEHSDHIKGVAGLARTFGVPVYMTAATHLTRAGSSLPAVHYIGDYQPFFIKDLLVTPVPVPHDAADPVQYIFSKGDTRLGILTDLGSYTQRIVQSYSGCHGLLLEANHDPQMLAAGPYPYFLKRRVGGSWGHLSNTQAWRFLASLDVSVLQTLVLAHISSKNNNPEQVARTFAKTDGRFRTYIANQTEGSPWFSVDADARSTSPIAAIPT